MPLARKKPALVSLHAAAPARPQPTADHVAFRSHAVSPRMPITQHVIGVLQQKIVSGEWAPGSRLESQRELALRLNVSRASLREAISSLEAFGLLSVAPGRGVFVASGEGHESPPSEAREAATPEQLYEARFLIEGWAAALAAVFISDDALAALGTTLQEMQAALKRQDHAALDRLDFEFHTRLAAACGNPLLRAVLAPAFTHKDMSNARIVNANFISSRVKEHREIFEAIASRDPQRAQQAMRTHVLRGAKRSHVKLSPAIEKLFV